MVKVLAGILAVLMAALGAQAHLSTRHDLVSARQQLSTIERWQASQPPSILAFELDKGNDEKLTTSDLCAYDATLLYLYSDSERSEALEEQLAVAAKEHPDKVAVVPVRCGGAADTPAPEGIDALGTPVSDPDGKLTTNYRVGALPAVVVLKSRPVYHATYQKNDDAGHVEASVDALLARDDLQPAMGCGDGGCGAGGGACMAGGMSGGGECSTP